jgi:hypothetical protein
VIPVPIRSRRATSTTGKGLSSRAERQLLALIAALLCVCISRQAVAQFLAPGPLAAPHAELEGDDKCSECHSAGKGISTAKCTACHTEVGASIAAGRGLHGRKFKGQPCAKCHSDHHGRGFQLIRWDPNALNHADTGWPLRGGHAKVKCAECHKTQSYFGLQRDCASCHEDPHENRFGGSCTTCHDETSWASLQLESFDHNTARFALRGAHAKVECKECHHDPAQYRGLAFDACTSCHDDPHQGELGADCESCHTEADWHGVHFKPGAHRWLSLANGHARVSCKRCHDRGSLRPPSRGRACVGCHAPVHEANFGKKCGECHARILWTGLPRRVGLAAHDKTPYPLEGRHEAVACKQCHAPELPPAQRYRELSFGRCADCHSDAHEGRFASRDGGECALCHTVKGFRPTLFGAALHESTGFALVGNHSAVPCFRCHNNEPKQGQRLDWRTDDTQCADCHENPHGDQFVDEMRQGGCASCHSAAGWHLPNIDHSTWPLVGAHATAACASCHTPTEADRKQGHGPSYSNAPRECHGCHEDLHRGQFRVKDPKRSCDFCHTSYGFKIDGFQHEKLTGYALEGSHRKLDCQGCHFSEQFDSGNPTVRYRLGYRTCRECHADPHREAAK